MRKRDAIDDVLKIVTEQYGVRRIDVMSQRRSRDVHRARCMGMFLAHKTGADSREIGRRFGGRDHTIVEAVCRNMARITVSDARHRLIFLKLNGMREAATARDVYSNDRTDDTVS